MSGRASFASAEGGVVIDAMVTAIDENADMLSQIDAAVGDGDHGINMRKGFLMARAEQAPDADLSMGLEAVGAILLTRIGGSAGPLFGSLLSEMGRSCRGVERIDAAIVLGMLEAGRDVVEELGGARLGDKTMLDTLAPAVSAYADALAGGRSFADALRAMDDAAERGKESTRAMVARLGRASRHGERSRGLLDAGATSCWLLLSALARSMIGLIERVDAAELPRRTT